MAKVGEDQDNRERIMSIRLSMAQAWAMLLMKAYDALLHHGINYRSLKEYGETAQFEEATRDDRTLEHGRAKVMEYIERVENGITAAIRRKSMKLAPV